MDAVWRDFARGVAKPKDPDPSPFINLLNERGLGDAGEPEPEVGAQQETEPSLPFDYQARVEAMQMAERVYVWDSLFNQKECRRVAEFWLDFLLNKPMTEGGDDQGVV